MNHANQNQPSIISSKCLLCISLAQVPMLQWFEHSVYTCVL